MKVYDLEKYNVKLCHEPSSRSKVILSTILLVLNFELRSIGKNTFLALGKFWLQNLKRPLGEKLAAQYPIHWTNPKLQQMVNVIDCR